jgi:hypothetical protein
MDVSHQGRAVLAKDLSLPILSKVVRLLAGLGLGSSDVDRRTPLRCSRLRIAGLADRGDQFPLPV